MSQDSRRNSFTAASHQQKHIQLIMSIQQFHEIVEMQYRLIWMFTTENFMQRSELLKETK